jgi:hypothetical protein
LSIAQDRRPSLQFSLKVCPAELFAIERTSRGARDVIDAMNLETNEPALSTFSSRVLSSRALLQSSTRVGNAGSCSRFR